jgi:steroid delta-isomerase-like uncharacterized protein
MKSALTPTALLAVALTVLVAGCATSPPRHSGTTKQSNSIVEKAFAAWNSQDPDKLVAAYGDDIVYEDVPSGSVSHGPAEFRKFAVLTFSGVGEFKIEAVKTWIENGHGVAEWVWTGVDKDWFNTGKRFSVQGVSIFEVRNGKISRNRDFYDVAAIRKQVGKLPE